MEQAVALSPRDAGYRLLLADIYLRSGRFESARATFADVLELDPAQHPRRPQLRADPDRAGPAGRPRSRQLDEIAGGAPPPTSASPMRWPAGTERAIEIARSAARSPNATPRIRQNLALAYASAGDWRRARAVAAQDVSPAELDAAHGSNGRPSPARRRARPRSPACSA